MIRKGSYILILDLPYLHIKVGALGLLEIKEGTYCYVGSAMNGLDQRIGRHLSEKKKIRWHIDYLTIESNKIEAYGSELPEITECVLGTIVINNGGTPSFKGFGCSDCSCGTHLFFLPESAREKLLSLPFLKKYPCL